MHRKLALVTVLSLLTACSDSGSHEHPSPADTQTQQATIDDLTLQTEELEARVATLQDDLDSAQQKLADSEAALERGDADAKAQATIAAAEHKRLENELVQARQALDAASEKLADRNYDAVAAELAAARRQIETLESARVAAPGNLGLRVRLHYGAEELTLDHPYAAPGGSLSFSTLRYWLSNLALVRADGSKLSIPNSYYLMGAMNAEVLDNGTQKSITLPAQRRELIALTNVAQGSYTAVELHVGVDAEHNDDLSLGGGELNVLRNMTGVQWMWFTSYIFTKSHATFTPSAAGAAALNVRWENGTNGDFRTVRIELPNPVKVDFIERPQIELKLDVAKLLNDLDAATVPVIGASDATNRSTLANNWAAAFRFDAVTTQP